MVPLFSGQHLLGGDLLYAGAVGSMRCLFRNAGKQLLCCDLWHGWGKMFARESSGRKKGLKNLHLFIDVDSRH